MNISMLTNLFLKNEQLNTCSFGIGYNVFLIKSHYDNTPMHYTAIFNGWKNDGLQLIFQFFPGFAQNIDCGHTLQSLRS